MGRREAVTASWCIRKPKIDAGALPWYGVLKTVLSYRFYPSRNEFHVCVVGDHHRDADPFVGGPTTAGDAVAA